MTINIEQMGLTDDPKSIEQLSQWQTENKDTAARLGFGALYQYYRYAWSQDLIKNDEEFNSLWVNRPQKVIKGKVYKQADEEISSASEQKEQVISSYYQKAIMESLEVCISGCGKNILPVKDVDIPKDIYGRDLIRITRESILDDLCKVYYAPTLVLFGPENVDEAIRRNIIYTGYNERLKKYIASGSIAVVNRYVLDSTGSGLEMYYGDLSCSQWQTPRERWNLMRDYGKSPEELGWIKTE